MQTAAAPFGPVPKPARPFSAHKEIISDQQQKKDHHWLEKQVGDKNAY